MKKYNTGILLKRNEIHFVPYCAYIKKRMTRMFLFPSVLSMNDNDAMQLLV